MLLSFWAKKTTLSRTAPSAGRISVTSGPATARTVTALPRNPIGLVTRYVPGWTRTRPSPPTASIAGWISVWSAVPSGFTTRTVAGSGRERAPTKTTAVPSLLRMIHQGYPNVKRGSRRSAREGRSLRGIQIARAAILGWEEDVLGWTLAFQRSRRLFGHSPIAPERRRVAYRHRDVVRG